MPTARWKAILGAAGLLVATLIGLIELRLALRGFQATVLDSEARWLRERARASRYGDRALILVGGSRIQLAADLDVLEDLTGLEPVQLAIDGSTFTPVLEGLARDSTINGTVVVDFSDHLLVEPERQQASHEWQAAYDGQRRRLPDFNTAEQLLEGWWRSHLRSYADGAQPITSLRVRIFAARPVQQYLVMMADRSRHADYTKVPMPHFYYQRVMRNLGEQVPPRPGMTFSDLDRELQLRIAKLQPMSEAVDRYVNAASKIAAQIKAITDRGGNVQFVMMPKSGLVKTIDDRRFPRALFWDRFVATTGVPALHFEDIPALGSACCPDGSHLDQRRRAEFSAQLVRALGLDRGP